MGALQPPFGRSASGFSAFFSFHGLWGYFLIPFHPFRPSGLLRPLLERPSLSGPSLACTSLLIIRRVWRSRDGTPTGLTLTLGVSTRPPRAWTGCTRPSGTCAPRIPVRCTWLWVYHPPRLGCQTEIWPIAPIKRLIAVISTHL